MYTLVWALAGGLYSKQQNLTLYNGNVQLKLYTVKPVPNSHSKIDISNFCLFCTFTSQVNSYGHGRTVRKPNHTFPGQA